MQEFNIRLLSSFDYRLQANKTLRLRCKRFDDLSNSKNLPDNKFTNQNNMHKRKTVSKRLAIPPCAQTTFTPEEALDLDYEICCCLEELERRLFQRPSSKTQRTECEKAITIITDPKVPVIRKRQIMRQTLGDYKAKLVVKPYRPRQVSLVFLDEPSGQGSIYFKTRKVKDTSQENVNVANANQLCGDKDKSVDKDSDVISSLKNLKVSRSSFKFNFPAP